jgi:DNA-binding LacI/PurR family transcriptional regulator
MRETVHENATTTIESEASAIATKRAVTLMDVALASGTSKGTASRALRDHGYVAAETRAAVLEAAKKLGFQANPHARRLSNGRCHDTIGLFALGLDSGVGIKKLQMVQHLLSARGFDVPVYAYIEGSNLVVDEVELLRALCLQRPRAIVWGPSAMTATAVEELQRYQDSGGIVLSYDHSTPLACDQVLFDRRDNTYQAARHLLELGHRKVGFYNVHTINPVRLEGFEKALQEFGLKMNGNWLFSGGIDEDGGAHLAQLYLEMPESERPTALCVVNDASAAAFIAEVGRQGIRVPEDVSIVGHDDLPVAKYSPLRISTVSHPVEEITRHVVELLCSRLENSRPSSPQTIVVKGSLVARESVIAIQAKPL